MYIARIPNRKSPPAILLREGYRHKGKVKTRTLANISHWPKEQIEAFRLVLRNEPLASPKDLFEILASPHHGHVEAVRVAMVALGFESLLASRPSRERDLIVAMVTARIVAPDSKLANVRWWASTTLPSNLDLAGVDEEECYKALDWLLARQEGIERKLAARHLSAGGMVLYDLSSSYFEGTTCPLATFGHNRDGKKGKLQVNYGLLTDDRGCPVAVSVFKGNTGDPKTLLPQVERVQKDFKIDRLVLVGDRGMITQTQIEVLRKTAGVDWITALRSEAIRGLTEGGQIQLGLFDERNLFELEQHPDYPGERLIACRNPELAKKRAHKRTSLLEATEKELSLVQEMVTRGTLRGQDKIGVRVGKVFNKYKVAKHFSLEIHSDRFLFHRDENKIALEAATDGIYVVRSSVNSERLSSDDTVRSYKRLSQVERAFRSMKTIDLHVRPIFHWLEDRVRAHIFLCMLAHYVQWHMFEAWRPLLFADEDQAAKLTRDPVAPAQRSESAQQKVRTKRLPDGSLAHSFYTLLQDLSTIVRNECRRRDQSPDSPSFHILTTPSSTQQRAFDLLKSIKL